jgi:hypothetical protein
MACAAGCSSVDPDGGLPAARRATVPSTEVTTTTGATPTSRSTNRGNPSRLDTAFVESIRSDTTTIQGTDQDVLDQGYAQCELLDQATAEGTSVKDHITTELLRQFGSTEKEAEDHGYLMGLSFTVLCPEYAMEAKDAFTELSETFGQPV